MWASLLGSGSTAAFVAGLLPHSWTQKLLILPLAFPAPEKWETHTRKKKSVSMTCFYRFAFCMFLMTGHVLVPWWRPAVGGVLSGRRQSLYWSWGDLCCSKLSCLSQKHGWKWPLTAGGHTRPHAVSLERWRQDSAPLRSGIHTEKRVERNAHYYQDIQACWAKSTGSVFEHYIKK